MAGLWDFGSRGGLWGLPDYMTPGGGLSQQLPDVMPGINDALAQNAALPPPKPGFAGKGGALWDIIGAVSDGFGDKGIYADAVKQNRALEADQRKYEQRRQDENTDWQARKDYERANQDNTPDWEKTAQWLDSQGRGSEAADIRAKATMVSTIQTDSSGEGRFIYARPSQLTSGGQNDNIPIVSSLAEASKLAPGSKFRPFPNGPIKTVPGGASPSNGSGGFRF